MMHGTILLAHYGTGQPPFARRARWDNPEYTRMHMLLGYYFGRTAARRAVPWRPTAAQAAAHCAGSHLHPHPPARWLRAAT